MILPGLYAILSPLAVGFLIGPSCLTGMLGGAIASGMMLGKMNLGKTKWHVIARINMGLFC
jgi:Na+/H+-translocating membrane pyrophosphatase